MNTINENIDNVIQWADNKDLLHPENAIKQHDKVIEEVIETRDAIVAYNCATHQLMGVDSASERAMDKIKDGIGDSFVTLIILAEQLGLTPEECLDHAWQEIKDRTGKTVNGTFVKD